MARYIELDKAHELVRMAKQYFWSSPVSTETHHTVDVDDIQFGLDKLPTVDAHQWISVKELLPEEDDNTEAWYESSDGFRARTVIVYNGRSVFPANRFRASTGEPYEWSISAKMQPTGCRCRSRRRWTLRNEQK